jgi:hypothetical protein
MIKINIIGNYGTGGKSLTGSSFLTPSQTKGATLRLTTLLFALFFLAMCTSNKEGTNRLSNACTSIEDLGKQVLEAVYNNDRERLKAMAITAEEYERYIWPQSPISKIKQWQEHYDFVWKQHSSRSGHSLSQVLSRYGGRQYTLVRVRFKDDTTDHTIYKAHRDARLIVKNPDGKEVELNLFGSIVEMDGQFKIMSFDTH